MINYPNGKKSTIQKIKRSTSNRGMNLEKDLNTTNLYYLEEDMANIHKKPTPIQVVNVDYPKRSLAKISEAYFKTPSTTDYNGVYRGKAIDFEAKECSLKSFPLTIIHKHQIDHLKSVQKHGAIAFIIVRFTKEDITYLLDASYVIDIYEKKDLKNHRKSIPLDFFKEKGHEIPFNLLMPVNYLKILDDIYF